MTAAPHEQLTNERHAAVVVELMRYNPRAFMAIYRPNNYVYDTQDFDYANDLERKCSELRIAFQHVKHWNEMKRMVRDLVRYDDRRRRSSHPRGNATSTCRSLVLRVGRGTVALSLDWSSRRTGRGELRRGLRRSKPAALRPHPAQYARRAHATGDYDTQAGRRAFPSERGVRICVAV